VFGLLDLILKLNPFIFYVYDIILIAILCTASLMITSLSLLATTLPAEPPPTTMKSYSLSGNALFNGLPHGSSMSHCDRMNTSKRPMNNMKADPPHVLANVGPGWVTGQLQLLLILDAFRGLLQSLYYFTYISCLRLKKKNKRSLG